MLRFRPDDSASEPYSRIRRTRQTRQRWRVWMLLIALGLVIATMRQLNKPSTARRLEQIFSTPETTTQHQPEQQFLLSFEQASEESASARQIPTPVDPSAEQLTEKISSDLLDLDMAKIQDNTYFRPVEDDAWFELLARLQQTKPGQLAKESVGELTYAQLLKQPQVYRGQVVTIHGTARREEIATPAENSLGLKTYHRLIIQPRGGGHWPFVVYCLNLPAQFPRGDNLQASLAVTGYFFKNWSYTWKGGLGVAPVVLAKSVEWQPKAIPHQRRSLSSIGLMQVLATAGLFAVMVVYLVIRNTRRPPRRRMQSVALPDEKFGNETVHQQLQRLAEIETQE